MRNIRLSNIQSEDLAFTWKCFLYYHFLQCIDACLSMLVWWCIGALLYMSTSPGSATLTSTPSVCVCLYTNTLRHRRLPCTSPRPSGPALVSCCTHAHKCDKCEPNCAHHISDNSTRQSFWRNFSFIHLDKDCEIQNWRDHLFHTGDAFFGRSDHTVKKKFHVNHEATKPSSKGSKAWIDTF